jgi:hypothetical protein
VGVHLGARRWLLATVSVAWLVRWALLSDYYEDFGAPGLDEKTWIHVVCPVVRSHGDKWVTKYEKGTAPICKDNHPVEHLEPCPDCAKTNGYHNRPERSG